jgi:(aminoalkyl)phosphonate N-acetyltransferase
MIREALKSDLSAVKLLVEELEEQTFDLDTFSQIFNKNIENPDVFYFVAEVDEKVVGFMSLFEYFPLHHCHKLAELQELIVNEKLRGTDIGRDFMVVAERLGKEKGWLQIELSSNMKRLKAHSFYLRNVFSRGHFKFVKKLK